MVADSYKTPSVRDTAQKTDIGLAINVLRILLRWTQKDLAKTIGIGTSSISDWETGKVVPRANSVERVLNGMQLQRNALTRTLGYIQEMRAALDGTDYPQTPPLENDIRDNGPGIRVENPATRREIDAMTRMVADLSRRFMEAHFGTLEGTLERTTADDSTDQLAR